MIVFCPLLLVLCFSVWLQDRAFYLLYISERVGRGRSPYWMVKLRLLPTTEGGALRAETSRLTSKGFRLNNVTI